MSDKLPALPPRPNFDRLQCPCDKCIGLRIAYMEAQDSRIKELEDDAESTAKCLGDMQLESIKQANKIAELDREIQEANVLIREGFYPLISGFDSTTVGKMRDACLGRNALRKS